MPSVSTELRYNEYYDMQRTFNWLYERSLNNQTKGIDLYSIIISENNIRLAYRNIKITLVLQRWEQMELKLMITR